MNRGVFILLEGLDGSGKTTQSKLLVEALQKHDYQAIFRRFPDRETIIGGILNEYLGNKLGASAEAAHLLFSANRWESQREIEDALNNGVHIVCDRYAISGVTYSVGAMGLSEKWCVNADEGIIAPDIIIHLYSDTVKSLLDRKDPGQRERYEFEDVQTRVKECYESLENQIKEKKGNWCNINALNSIEDIARNVYDTAIRAIDQNKNAPIRHLWNFN